MKAEILSNYDTLIFDLDDTLYPEIAYLTRAFHAISKEIAEKHAVNAAEVASFLITTFEKEGRSQLFNKCFNHFLKGKKASKSALKPQNTEGVSFEKNVIDGCLHILRTVQFEDKIVLFPYVYTVFPQLLADKKQIIVLTNGNVQQQKNKIAHLDWQNLDAAITFVFANEYAPKPSPKVFNDFLEPHFNLKNKKIRFIGDAETDAQFSQNIGADFLHVDFFK